VKVYIAADSHQQGNVKLLRDALLHYDVVVTSRWIDADLEAFHPTAEEVLTRAAEENFLDIRAARYLIAYNPLISHKTGTGGRHVEVGYALGQGKHVLYIGEKLENVFHRHPSVEWMLDPSNHHIETIAHILFLKLRDMDVRRESER
jgi:nucleoside 2-deoxyribosyltransferase